MPTKLFRLLPIVLVLATTLAATQWQSLGPKDTFRAANLSAGETQDIVKQIEDSAYDMADDWASELHVRRVARQRPRSHIAGKQASLRRDGQLPALGVS